MIHRREWPGRLTGVAVAGLVLFWQTSATAQRLGQAGDDGVAWWRVIGALVICLGLAAVAAMVLRGRMGGLPAWGGLRLKLPGMPDLAGRRTERRLRLLETVRLSHQVDVCLLECDGAPILIAASAHGATVLRDGRPRAVKGSAT